MSTLEASRLPALSEVLGRAPEENFPVALGLLGRTARRHLLSVYAYARLVDEVGDREEGSPAEHLADLDTVERELDAARAGEARHPVFERLAGTIAECHLERAPLADLIEANRIDQKVDRYETFEELVGYCRYSADPVGRLVLAVFGETGEDKVTCSDLVCTGLQLVEHFQDVAEDAARGRVYLPGEDFDRFSVPRDLLETRPASEPAPAGFRRMMAFEVGRARRMLVEGSRLVGLVRPRAAVAIAGFAGGGLAQLGAIERAGYDVLSESVKASDAAVAREALGLLARRRNHRGGGR